MPPATEQLRSRPTGLEPDFIELPTGSPSSGLDLGAVAAPPRPAPFTTPERPRQTRRNSSRAQAAVAPIAADSNRPKVDDRPWNQKIVGWIRGEDGAGYGISLIVHLVTIAVLAIPVIRHFDRGSGFATVTSEPFNEGGGGFGGFVDTELADPVEVGEGQSLTLLPEQMANDALPIANALFSGSGGGKGGGGDGHGAGDGGFGAGIGPFVPGNAVTKGSFTAWTTPTYGVGYPRRFGEPDPKPGDSPRPGQPYFITIQIKVPADREWYPIADIKGTVVGTDRWVQSIPEYTFWRSNAGELISVKGRTSIPVVDGKVQFLVRVPGADELVKDTIQVSSRMLKEKQTLELVFE